jgi:hypothetical protein
MPCSCATLIPYLYSMAWRFHRRISRRCCRCITTIPRAEEAYACPNQYLCLAASLIAPFITPKDPDTRLSRSVAWLPEGDWYDFFSGKYYAGDAWYPRYGTLREIPVFARAGAIVPQEPKSGKLGIETPLRLVVHVFPGADGAFDLYEDEGNTNDYLKGDYAITPMRQRWEGSRTTLTIGSAEGAVAHLPATRHIDVLLRGFNQPARVTVTRGGETVQVQSHYTADTLTLTVTGIEIAPSDQLEVVVEGGQEGLANRNDDRLATCRNLIKHFRMESWSKADLFRRMPEIVKDPASLGRYQPILTASQMRALMEVITGAGIDFTDSTGEGQIVLWNNCEDAKVTHLNTVNRIHQVWRHKEPRPLTSGTLPRFQSIRPKQDFGEGNPYVIALNYYEVFQVEIRK